MLAENHTEYKNIPKTGSTDINEARTYDMDVVRSCKNILSRLRFAETSHEGFLLD